jgi:hypothetical protein
VIDKETPADGGPRVNFNSREEAPNLRHEPRKKWDPPAVQAVGNAVQQNGVQARIAEEYLKDALGGRVLTEDGVDLLFDGSEHCVPDGPAAGY